MKKITFIILVLIITGSAFALPIRWKIGLNDYNYNLTKFKFSNGIYRLNTRFDLMNLASRLGIGTAANISFKSDNHNIDFYNNYDFYLHNLYGEKSKTKGNYMVYGLIAGMRVVVVNSDHPDYWDKVTYTFSSYLLGAMVSRSDWGLEIMASQTQKNNWKFDFSTKYSFAENIYLEFSYCYKGPIEEIENDFSITIGLEFFTVYEKKPPIKPFPSL